MGNRGAKKGESRRKGKPNKFTASAKEAFQIAFDKLGGADGLALWAKDNQTDFYKLFSKLIPVDVTNNGQSFEGGILVINGKTVTQT